MNINDDVWVKLTPAGEATWTAYWKGQVPHSIRISHQLPDGWTRFQMHELMNIFGPTCYNGSSWFPFENMEILLEEMA